MQFRAPLIALTLLAALAGCGVTPPPVGEGNEVCDNGKDDNRDGKVDCLDPKCFSHAKCGLVMREDCANTSDDDNNGKIDCEDPACEGESCGSGCLCLGGQRTTGTGGGGAGVGGGNSGGGNSGGGNSGGGNSGGGNSGGGSVVGGGSAPLETNCANNLDDDGDNATDCDDADCMGVTCGMGCTCALNRRVEMNCGDNLDNDGDGQRDCADSDCVGVGTEVCDDGIDNTCDRAIDCGDTKCTGNSLCTGVQDGKACLAANQCASGRCQTEALDGFPNGLCTNATPCSVTNQTGCNGGRCVTINGQGQCLASCIGTGLGASGRCRVGYACVDSDSNPNNATNTCRALCSSDQECSGSGTGYGCNPWSKLCQSKDRGLGKYGAGCTTNSQCEGGLCQRSPSFPNGYCMGVCRADTRSCASNGLCSVDPTYGDNLGFCFQGCMGAGTAATCRVADNYKCWPLSQGGPTACICIGAGGPCVIGGNSDCCSGICQAGACQCLPVFATCGTDRECCSGTCILGSCGF
ncbi:MAG: hypothetical protein Q8L14_17375 [Myxococcales bacterium]|nr:hypothetical protein [Myxococcales bacterium]